MRFPKVRQARARPVGKGPGARRRAAKRRKVQTLEFLAKAAVRARDYVCRFPECGCHMSADAMKSRLTVSHDRHKGMGGDPGGARSQAQGMILLCKWRHQAAPISRHAGTVRTRYLTDKGNDGPIAFDVDARYLVGVAGIEQRHVGYSDRPVWMEVAVEESVGVLAPRSTAQSKILAWLREMTR